jgi:hypothetical protein
MKAMLVGLAVAIIAAAAGCGITQKSLQEKGLKPVTQKELEERYARPVKISFVNDRRQSGTAEFTPDGSVRVSWSGGGDTGKWWIKDGKFCTKYSQIRNGAEACFINYRTGPKEYVSFNADGSYNATATDIE